MRLSPPMYRRICLIALWSLCGIVVTGAAVRLTGSGLGCRDWPTCESNRIVAPWEFKAQVEFINRMITGLVSLAVIVAVGGSLVRTPRRRDLTRWSLALVAGVIAQIIIGAFVTKSELKYSVVGVHFLVSMVLVWAATVLVDKAGRPDETAGRADETAAKAAPPAWTWVLSAAAVGVLCSGPVVTSAGPHAGSAEVKRLPLDLSDVARVHSGFVWVLCGVTAWVAWKLRAEHDALLRRRSVDLLGAVVAQGALGYLQYFTAVPAVLVGAHVAGAALVWVLVVRLVLAGRASHAQAIEPTAAVLAR